MASTINQHGEQVWVIGTIKGYREDSPRIEIKVTEFGQIGDRRYALTGGAGGYPDARRFTTQVKRAKRYMADESLDAKWFC